IATKLHIPQDLVKSWVLPGAGIGEDARYFPKDCKAIAVVNVANIVRSEAYQSADAEADKEGGAVAGWKTIGPDLSVTDLASITAGAGGEEGRPTVVVLRFNKPVSAADIRAAPRLLTAVQVVSALVDGREANDLVKPEELNFEQETAGGYTTYEC